MTNNFNQKSWRETLIPIDSTIQRAIHSLEASGMQIVLVVSSINELIGTLTDGDIRRAFLKGAKLSDPIDRFINRSPLVTPPEVGRNLILKLMQANKIFQIPVVDHNGKVIDLYVWDSVNSTEPVENIMVIMAGGRGTRLAPHTENCPKPMLEVGGKPMLEHIIERAKESGFRKFIISLYYLGHMIEDYFKDGDKWGVNIEYLKETSPLGTAGCLSIMQAWPNNPFVVTNGDVLTDISYRDILEFHKTHQASATMAVRQHELQNQFGVVKIKGIEIEGFEEKPTYVSHINAGIYVINPDVLSMLDKERYCDMPTLFSQARSLGKRTIVYPMHEPWLDVGRPADLQIANDAI